MSNRFPSFFFHACKRTGLCHQKLGMRQDFKEIQSALEIGAIEFVIKYPLYFAHERAWDRIPLGSVRRIAEG